MSNLYQALCVVRTSVLNVIGQSILQKRQKNMPDILESIATEINSRLDFVEEINKMNEDQLLDLGFDYLNNESNKLLIPVWLYPFIPQGTMLVDIEGIVFQLSDENTLDLYSDSWVAASFYG